MEPLISANEVEETFAACLLEPPEDTSLTAALVAAAEDHDVVIVEGIVTTTAFSRSKLEKHREEILTMLHNLPREFQASPDGGGGWSFLNACQDANDVQWTGLHRTMGHLFDMGIALDIVACLIPRELWVALPGGMPYYAVTA